jgi:UDPglucose 6-dehydrogenase
MRVGVVGCGYLGAVHAAGMASLGHSVTGVDTDSAKIAALQRGEAPFFEPDFPDLLADGVSTGNLEFSTDFGRLADCQVIFVSVGTPQRSGSNEADLTFIRSATDSIRRVFTKNPPTQPVLFAGKSTVPVGTAAMLAEQLADTGVLVAWNPEFLQEGHAVHDTLHPDRIVYGLPVDSASAHTAQSLLDRCYAQILAEGTPQIVTDYQTAELVKVAANSFLATKISFINAMALICEAAGADVTQLATAIGYDDRIGKKFLKAGLGFGGGCLPKDIRAFSARAGQLGIGPALTFLTEVDQINLRMRKHVIDMARDLLGGSLRSKRVAVLGAAFKPESDDLRDSPAVAVAIRAANNGASVRITDPAANDRVRAAHSQLEVVDTWRQACTDADLVILATEWPEFRALTPDDLDPLVSARNIIDARNVLTPDQWKHSGWTYRGVGRS